MGKVGRLTKPSEYRHVYKNAIVLKTEVLYVYLMPNSSKCMRTGVSIRARVVKKAVDRNRLRRVIKEWFAHNLDMYIRKNSDLVAVVRRPVGGEKRGSALIRNALKEALQGYSEKTGNIPS